MHFTCESCRATLHIADEKVKGKRLIVRCKRCGNKITIADPALGAAGLRAPAARKPAPAPAPEPARPVDPDAGNGDSDTESTRAMETAVLEEALRASKALGEDASGAMQPVQAPPAGALPRDPPIWFAMVGGKQLGPVSRAELGLKTAQGAVGPRTYVWREGMSAWQRAKDVGELSSLFAAAPERPLPPPPIATPLQSPRAAAARGSSQRDFSTGDFGDLNPHDQAAPAQPSQSDGGTQLFGSSPLVSKPSPSGVVATSHPVQRPEPKVAPLDISIEGYKPLNVDEGGDSTNVEPLPLGERIHQENVAQELFTSGEQQSGASAIDLARWASDELAKKEKQRNSVTSKLGPSKPLNLGPSAGDTPGAQPLVRSTATGPFAATRVRSNLSAPREVNLGEVIEQARAASRKRTLILAVAIASAIALVLLLLYGFFGRDGSKPAVKVEVATQRPALGSGGDASKAGAAQDQKGGAKASGGEAQAARADTGLKPEDFERAVADSKGAYKKCIDEAPRGGKSRVGKVQIAMKIAPTGKVLEASIDKKDVQESPLGQCLIRTTERIVFPPFAGEPADGVIPLHLTAGE